MSHLCCHPDASSGGRHHGNVHDKLGAVLGMVQVRGDLRHVCLEALAGNTAKGKEGLQLKADAARLQDRLKKVCAQHPQLC